MVSQVLMPVDKLVILYVKHKPTYISNKFMTPTTLTLSLIRFFMEVLYKETDEVNPSQT